MDYDFGERASELRDRLRELIATEIPEGYLGAFTDNPEDLAVAQRFCRRMAEEGLLTWAWPHEYGGAGGTVWEQTVVREEMWAHHEPRGAQYMGLNWVGPAIMAFGSDEQKQQFLPSIAAGEVIWCQGFSEPGAGSDLASLSTKAVPFDDGFQISGQKIWTSYAQMAQWCVLAARVGQAVEKKHDGITIFLIPMDREGISVRPIQSMLGPHHLNEMFFDNVWAGPGEVLGGVGNGWNVIRRALAHERVGIARYARCDRLLSRWSATNDVPPELRTQWVRALVAVRVARLLAYKAIADPTDDAAASAARVAVTQCDQQVAELLFHALADRSLEGKYNESAPLGGAIEDHWRYAQAATVAGGTIEIQRMIVSRALLGGRS